MRTLKIDKMIIPNTPIELEEVLIIFSVRYEMIKNEYFEKEKNLNHWLMQRYAWTKLFNLCKYEKINKFLLFSRINKRIFLITTLKNKTIWQAKKMFVGRQFLRFGCEKRVIGLLDLILCFF